MNKRQQDWMYLLGLHDSINIARMFLYTNMNKTLNIRAIIIEDLTQKSNNI